MIRFQCPACRSVLQAAPATAGAVVACAKCRQTMRVPAPPSQEIRPPAEPRKPAVQPRPVASPPRPRAVRPPQEPEPRAAPRRRSRSRSSVLPVVAVLGLVALVGAAGGTYYLWSRPAPAPQTAKEDRGKNILVAADRGAKTAPKEKQDDPPPRPEPEADRLPRALVELINKHRQTEGVTAVKLHEARSRACREHAAYLIRNGERPFLDPHEQESDLPGASDTGRQAARVASIARAEPREALRAWLTAPGHRALLLAKELTDVGVGLAQGEDGKWVTVLDMVSGGVARLPPPSTMEPVIYPAHRQANVPLMFPGNEVPDPLPDAKDKIAGFPVTVTFPSSLTVTAARAWLEDESGTDVPVWFSSPTKPANEKHARLQQNTVCLFAREVLRAGTRYVVRVEAQVGDREWARTWTFTTQPPVENGRRIYERALEQLNAYREAAGLGPVTLDDDLSRPCLAHARYLALHLDRVKQLSLDTEDENLEGYTEEGKKIAARSMVRLGGGVGAMDAFDWVMASVLNRHLALNPSMKTVGMGAALQSPRGWIWVINGTTTRRDGDGPLAILYPGKGQKDIPLYFGREIASLIKDQPKDAAAGFAVTANFFPLHKVTNSTAKLTDAEGNEVSCWLSTPEKRLPGTGNYRQILLAPKKPLAPATTYTATMSARINGAAWSQTWSFTTLDQAAHSAQVAAVLLKRVNEARSQAQLAPVTLDEKLSKPCRLHADYIVRNLDHPKVQGLGIHEEDPSLPGATKEGAKAGTASVIAIISDPIDSVDGWLATIYHRLPLLSPRLKRIGYGQAQHLSRGWATVLDASSGR